MPKKKNEQPIGGDQQLCSDDVVLRTEFSKRRLALVFASVPNAKVLSMLDGGWIPFKEGKTRTRFQQPKQLLDQVTDDLWCFLYRMGYKTLNLDEFQISYDSHTDGMRKRVLIV